MNTTPSLPNPEVGEPLPAWVDVLVVGAGFGGIAMLHRLASDHPDRSVLVIEREGGPGGVWRVNDYPGAACDVPSALYSLSFADNPDWTHTFGRQDEIQRYLTSVASRFDDRIRYGCELIAARWDEPSATWVVETGDGVLRCRHLVPATGALSAPTIPAIPGLDTFAGSTFHSAEWNHERSLAGRRVAVVGSGASAVQIVPEIVDEAAHLTVFQRTPSWVIPRLDRRISRVEKVLYRRIPRLHRAVRHLQFATHEFHVLAMAHRPEVLNAFTAIAKMQLRKQVSDVKLRRRLTPNFTIGCKRILLSNRWLPTLDRADVTVAGALVSISGDTATDDTGESHTIDTLIFATGFTPTAPPIARRISVDGTSLAQVWGSSPSAYRGVSVAGFPNLHLLYGPNTNLGHSSIILMLEAQAHYIGQLLAYADRAGLDSVQVTATAQEAFNADLDDQLDGTVWNDGGCASWYIDDSGRNSVMWPTYIHRYRRLMGEFDPRDHQFAVAERQIAEVGA